MKMVMVLTLRCMYGSINEAVREAIDISRRVVCYVEFDFNGHKVLVSPSSEEKEVISTYQAAIEQNQG